MSQTPVFPPLAESRPVCWGHRGDSANRPENTMAAFEAALAAGADGIELDVALSRDGLPVVIHDPVLDRTSSGSGRVADHDWEDLSRLDAGSWFDPRFADQRLSLLPQVLDAFGSRCLINIEIKPEAACTPAGKGVETQVLEHVRSRGLADSVLVSSFNYQSLLVLRDQDPDLKLGVLCRGTEENIDFRSLVRAVDAFSFHARIDALVPEAVEIMHADGVRVFTWGKGADNAPPAMKRALEIGVDGFFANDPGVFSQLIAGG